jgi:hypothetical protein
MLRTRNCAFNKARYRGLRPAVIQKARPRHRKLHSRYRASGKCTAVDTIKQWRSPPLHHQETWSSRLGIAIRNKSLVFRHLSINTWRSDVIDDRLRSHPCRAWRLSYLASCEDLIRSCRSIKSPSTNDDSMSDILLVPRIFLVVSEDILRFGSTIRMTIHS